VSEAHQPAFRLAPRFAISRATSTFIWQISSSTSARQEPTCRIVAAIGPIAGDDAEPVAGTAFALIA